MWPKLSIKRRGSHVHEWSRCKDFGLFFFFLNWKTRLLKVVLDISPYDKNCDDCIHKAAGVAVAEVDTPWFGVVMVAVREIYARELLGLYWTISPHKVSPINFFLCSRELAVVAPHRRLILVPRQLHDVPNFETGIIHPLNSGCAKTV